MADLLSWLGDAAKNVENTIGGVVNGVGGAVNSVVKPVTDSIGTFGNALGTDASYLGNQITGANAARQKQVLQSQAQAYLDKVRASQIHPGIPQAPQFQQQQNMQKQQLLHQAQGNQNIANAYKQGQQQQIQQVNQNLDPTKLLASDANILSTVAAPGMSKVAGFIGDRAAPVVGQLGGKIIGNALAQAPVGAVLGATGQLQQTGAQTNPGDLLGAAGAGALGGAVLGGAAPVVEKGLQAGAKGLVKAYNTPEDGFAKVPGGKQPTPEVPKTTGKLSNPNDIGAALGMSKAEVAKAKSASAANQAPLAIENGTSHLSAPTEPTPPQVGIKGQTVLSKEVQPPKVNPSKADIAQNPTKVDIPKVNPGDYEKARANGQLAGETVNFHTGQVLSAVNKLKPAEKANFWHSVEDPSIPRSPKMQEAVSRWQDLSNRIHATSQALGGDTAYRANYAKHNWDLSNPDQKALFDQITNAKADTNLEPGSFSGLDRKQRAFDTVAQGEAAGFKLKNPNNPAQDIIDYGNKSAFKLKQQAVIKGVREADQGQVLNRSVDLKNGQPFSVSEQGKQAMRTMEYSPTARAPLQAYRTFNRKTKQLLLSASQFHTININGLQAAPALIAKGHPVRAVTGLVDSAVTLFSKNHSDELLQNALKDGTIENAARIGTPIKYGTDYSAGGKLELGKSGIGEKAIFERQLPAMHVQMVKALVSDLQKKGIPLDSPQARQAGTTINEIMGYVNMEMKNLNPHVQKGLSDVLLAPQFTRSKWAVLKDAFTKGGQAGRYARAAVIGKYGAEAALIAAAGAIAGQKSDDLKDTLLRALLHPSIPTPMLDSKGNNIEFGLPQNYVSEALGLVGNLQRNNDGRLQPNINPSNIIPNVENYGRSRLGMIPSDALKVGTNTNYAGKPLYDPSASLGTKVAQTATTLGAGHLPIGLQGVTQLPQFKNAMPGDIQQVLNAQDTGKSPILKALASSFGATARTDNTVGQGQQTTQYFNALSQAAQGLNAHETDIFKQLTDSKKNPVTGAYDTSPSVYDAPAKANDLLQNPGVLAHLNQMNQTLQKQGQTVDPFYNLTPQQQTQVLQINRLDPNTSDKTQLTNLANRQGWYKNFQTAQSNYFSSLPAGDPNRPQAPVKYQAPSQQAQDLATQYYNLTDPTAKANFIKANPAIQDAFNATSNYDAAIRAARGDPALKGYPTASPQLQQQLNTYSSLGSKASQSAYAKANPGIYNYFQQVSQYALQKDAAQAQYQGNNFTQSGSKAITSLASDIKYNGGLSDANGNIISATAPKTTGTGGKSGSKRSKAPSLVSITKATTGTKASKVPAIKSFSKPASVTKSVAYKAPSIKAYSVPKLTPPKVRTKRSIA